MKFGKGRKFSKTYNSCKFWEARGEEGEQGGNPRAHVPVEQRRHHQLYPTSLQIVPLVLLVVRTVPTFLNHPWHVLFLAQHWRFYEEPKAIN